MQKKHISAAINGDFELSRRLYQNQTIDEIFERSESNWSQGD